MSDDNSGFKYRIQLFGQIQVIDDLGRAPHFYSDKVLALLAYLLVEGEKPLDRASLSQVFWPRYLHKSALTNLRKALYELRLTLKGTQALKGSRRQMWMVRDGGEIWCDWWEAEARLEQLANHEHRRLEDCQYCQAHILHIRRLINEGFCVGFSINEPDGFDRWKIEAAVQLKRRLQSLLSGRRSTQVNRAVGNLAYVEHPLVGREVELQELSRLASALGTEALSIIGMGGIGKSHLARVFARRICGAYPDGIWLCPMTENTPSGAQALEGASGAQALLESVAAIIGLPEAAGEPILRERLRHHQAVVILDGFERRLLPQGGAGAALAELRELINTMPRTRFIVTSRESLGLDLGVEFELKGLAIELPRVESLEERVKPPSVSLFMAHRMARLDLKTVSDSGWEMGLEICRLLEGHPLAVKLAGALSQKLPLKVVLEQLKRDPMSLMSPYRDTLPRHRGLGPLLESSLDGLSPQARLTLALLATWEGDARFEDLKAVVASLPLKPVKPSDLEELSRRCLVEFDGKGAYRLHPLVRGFAEGQVPRWQEVHGWGDGFVVAVTHSATRHFLKLLARNWKGLILGELKVRKTLRKSMPDVINAWRYGLKAGLVSELVEALPGFIQLGLDCGQLGRCTELVGELATSLEGGGLRGSAIDIAQSYFWLGVGFNELGHPLRTLKILRLVKPEYLGPAEVGYLRVLIGIQLSLTGQEAEATRMIDAALHVTPRSDWLTAYVHTTAQCHKGMWLARKGLPGAEVAAREALDVSRQQGFLRLELRALLTLGGIKVTERQLEAALALLREGGALADAYDVAILKVRFLHAIAFTHSCLGDQLAALTVYEEVQELCHRHGLVHLGGQIQLGRAATLRSQGALEQATTILEEALGMEALPSQPLLYSRALAMYAVCLGELGHPSTPTRLKEARHSGEALGYWPTRCLVDTADLSWSLRTKCAEGVAQGVERVLAWISAHPGLPNCDCFYTYLICYRGLSELDDPRREPLFKEMVALLERDLDGLSSPEARQQLLQGDPAAAEIHQLLRERGEGDDS